MSVQQHWSESHIIALLAESGSTTLIDGRSMLFDPDWYRARYPDAADHGNPVEHYMQIGWRLGHDPNALFSTRHYLAANPDVTGRDLNPFVHYVLYGARQGRRPSARD